MHWNRAMEEIPDLRENKIYSGMAFWAYGMGRACRKEYTGVRKGYRRNEYDKNNACIKQ